MNGKNQKVKIITILLCFALIFNTIPAWADSSDPVSREALEDIVRRKVESMSFSVSGLDAIIESINNNVKKSVTSIIQSIGTTDQLRTIAAPIIISAIKESLAGLGIELPDGADVDDIVNDIMGSIDTVLTDTLISQILAQAIENTVANIMSIVKMPTTAEIIEARKEQLIQEITDELYYSPLIPVSTLSGVPKVKKHNAILLLYDYTVDEWFIITPKKITINGWHEVNIKKFIEGYIGLTKLNIKIDSFNMPSLDGIDFDGITQNALQGIARNAINDKIKQLKDQIKSAAEEYIRKAKALALEKINEMFEDLGLSVTLDADDTDDEIQKKIEDALNELTSEQRDEILSRLAALKQNIKIKCVPMAVRLIDCVMNAIGRIKPVIDIDYQVLLSSSLTGDQIVIAPESGEITVSYTALGQYRLKYADHSTMPPTGVWSDWRNDPCNTPVITCSLTDPSGEITGVSWDASENKVVVGSGASAGIVTVTATYQPAPCVTRTETLTLEIKRPEAPEEEKDYSQNQIIFEKFIRHFEDGEEILTVPADQQFEFTLTADPEIYPLSDETPALYSVTVKNNAEGKVIFGRDTEHNVNLMPGWYILTEAPSKSYMSSIGSSGARLYIENSDEEGKMKALFWNEEFNTIYNDEILRIEKTVSRNNITVGESVVYQVKVTNVSQNYLYGVSITDVLNGENVLNKIESFEPGEQKTFSYSKTFNAVGTYTNKAIASYNPEMVLYSSSDNQSDDDDVNGISVSASVTVVVREAPQQPQQDEPEPDDDTTYYMLTVQIEGSGSILPSVGGSYAAGSVVVFSSATAADGWEFDGLYENGTKLPDNRVYMDGNKTVIARFVETVDVQEDEVPAQVPEVTPTPTETPAVTPAPEITPAPEESPASEQLSQDDKINGESGSQVIVLDEPVPSDSPKLPQTGGIPDALLYTFGAALSGTGILIGRKKKEEEE